MLPILMFALPLFAQAPKLEYDAVSIKPSQGPGWGPASWADRAGGFRPRELVPAN